MTTFRVGGPVKHVVTASTADEMAMAVHGADEAGIPLLVIGGGSNLLVSDEPFEGVVVRDGRSKIIATQPDPSGKVFVTACAGTTWDDFVQWSIAQGLSGLEALSGIPGTVGAAPVQNIGAYGHEVASTLHSVRAWDRQDEEMVVLSAKDLQLGYRTSIIKRSTGHGGTIESEAGQRIWGPTGRWVVVEATFALEKSELSAPVLYAELATKLGVKAGERAPSVMVREAVLGLRRGKGMVLDEGDHDSWSAGSFFTNPILTRSQADVLPQDAPRFGAGVDADGVELVKTSAAWLIDHAGFGKGWALNGADASQAPASLSTKHVLALTNRGSATAEDIRELALAVRAGVEERFGIRLVPEPVAVGFTW
ncbi:UDP-N-acetylmuramate dehydrogenase [Schaalia vaccimaxillae]|uniref:UDP-N-acetylmuramate dehydrogenase n=1 Tax=Schaalia vaccimaxillae TaxID=183916 RepID=UPI0005900CB1|nr:UDP-N-acetylmuramate dehydrogenase [Schaalia vaccimaxillae]